MRRTWTIYNIIVLHVIRGSDDYGVKHNNIIPSLKNPDGGSVGTNDKQSMHRQYYIMTYEYIPSKEHTCPHAVHFYVTRFTCINKEV